MSLLALALLLAPPVDWRPQTTQRADGAVIVPLSVTRCLMKEVEVDPLLYTAKSAASCARINRATEKTRIQRRLRLPAGRYAFRVRNLDVPWLVDFALKGAHEKGLPHTSGGQMKPGDILDYVVVLKPGVYVFGSPLGGTPEYRLLVESQAPARR